MHPARRSGVAFSHTARASGDLKEEEGWGRGGQRTRRKGCASAYALHEWTLSPKPGMQQVRDLLVEG